MSDNENSGNNASPKFTERELQLLGWAMQSLKSGPPDIDYERLAAFAGMGNPRSASNAWAKIKNKLITNPDATVPTTPKKGGAKKKLADKSEDGEDTPKKTPRKRTAKSQDVDGDASPKKKGGRGKKASDDEPTNVKTEPDESLDDKLNGSPAKPNTAEELADEI